MTEWVVTLRNGQRHDVEAESFVRFPEHVEFRKTQPHRWWPTEQVVLRAAPRRAPPRAGLAGTRMRRPRWYVSGDLEALAAWLLCLAVSGVVLAYALGWLA